MGTVSVVIPVARPTERLLRCLDALARQHLQPEEVVVVTAAMGEVRLAGVQRPKIRSVPCPAPPSFCRAVNVGIQATRSDWVLMLNDDVIVSPDCLQQLLAGIPADARIGMVCGKLLAGDGRTIDSTGQFVSRARTALERGYGEVDRGQFDTPGDVFSVPGAAALYRRRMLDELAERGQYFDERFGMYLEDLDFGRRAQRAGWRAYYVPDAVGVHLRGATAKTRPPRWRWLRRYYLPWLSPELQARYVVNRYRLMAKHDTWWRLLKDSPWILWYELRLWAYLLCAEPRTLRLLWDALWQAVRLRADPTPSAASSAEYTGDGVVQQRGGDSGEACGGRCFRGPPAIRRPLRRSNTNVGSRP